MTEREIFLAVLDLPDPSARAKYLDRACGGDPARRSRIEALLRSHDTAGSFLGSPAVAPPDPNVAATLEVGCQATPGDCANPDDEALAFLTKSARADSLGRIGHYEVLEVLGKGGFGIVFRAFDEVLQRVVAVKVLAPQLAVTSPARKRFLREARSSAKVRHENVVQVYAVEEHPLPYLVMEFIPGETLQQRLDRTGPVEVTEVVQIGRQIAEGLAAAHGTSLIHRDIKPGNILLEAGPNLHVKITDFGLARAADDASLTQSGILAGTPMFMSPEQASGEHIDQRADLFSLGSVLYTMTSGRPPFRAPNTLAVLKRVAEDTPRPIPEIMPEVPRWLCDIIDRLHAKKPEDRFASARDVADLLARCLAEMQQPGYAGSVASPIPVPAVVRPSSPRIRRWTFAAAVLLLGLIGLGVTEASGVTNMRGTVIHLFSPEGTLVVEVDDPGVSVTVDGEEIIITGTGAKEIRLKPGQYKVMASKDGKTVREELVRVERNGKQVVRVRREGSLAVPQPAAGATESEKSVAALPAVEQVNAVLARLQKLNPGFNGQVKDYKIEGAQVIELAIHVPGIVDLSPVRALTSLRNLEIAGSTTLVNLAPLKGMRLLSLSVRGSAVSDLSPLMGMELIGFECTGTKVSDLTPLKGVPLRNLQIAFTQVKDLESVRGMLLEELNCESTKVADLTPLAGMPLTRLNAANTPVADLKPLKGMKLEYLTVGSSRVADLTPLQGMPLTILHCENTPVADLTPLAGMPLKGLQVQGTRVTKLTPLAGMSLEYLNCSHTRVTDLSPLKSMKLQSLFLDDTKVADLSPLRGMPLKALHFRNYDLQPDRDREILRSLDQLETINSDPAADFLKKLDAKEDGDKK